MPAERRPARLRVGVAGSGFVARRFVAAFHGRQGIEVTRILTRRPLDQLADLPLAERATNDLGRLVEDCEVVLEASGDPVHATRVVETALAAGRPVATMNAEFHVTAGSAFVGRGLLTECLGDQPGAAADLAAEASEMGFTPLLHGNLKGFLNLDPTPEEMRLWAGRQGISLAMVTASTDGTKVQVEQALVANWTGADILAPGLRMPRCEDWRRGLLELAGEAQALGRPVSDLVVSPGAPHGVALVATHAASEAPALAYYKMGPGPLYTLLRPHILVHLEIPRTLRRLVEERRVTLDNSPRPRISVAAVAKRRLTAGTRIGNGIGSFELRGSCVRIAELPEHLPIGLCRDLVLERAVEPGQVLALSDVALPASRALDCWLAVRDRVLGRASEDSMRGEAWL